MPKKPRTSYNSRSSWVNVNQLATYFGVHRNTLRLQLKAFRPDYDLHSVDDILDFVIWYAQKEGIIK